MSALAAQSSFLPAARASSLARRASRRPRSRRPRRAASAATVASSSSSSPETPASSPSETPPSSSFPLRVALLASALTPLATPGSPLRPPSALAAPPSGAVPVTFDAVPNERWVALPATIAVPSDWSARPGQRAKQSKFMLYTDTYGPNYRYTTALPRFVDADGAVAANALQLAVQSRGGQESVADLGPIANIDAAKAFGIEAEDIQLAETVKAATRTDAGKQLYYQWDLALPTGNVVLIAACVSGGGLYVFSAEATAAQWGRHEAELRAARDAFEVRVAAESTTDISNRIYNNASDGGFK